MLSVSTRASTSTFECQCKLSKNQKVDKRRRKRKMKKVKELSRQRQRLVSCTKIEVDARTSSNILILLLWRYTRTQYIRATIRRFSAIEKQCLNSSNLHFRLKFQVLKSFPTYVTIRSIFGQYLIFSLPFENLHAPNIKIDYSLHSSLKYSMIIVVALFTSFRNWFRYWSLTFLPHKFLKCIACLLT